MCGSTTAQNNIQAGQISAYQTLQNEAGDVFGQDSALYTQLVDAFTPILQNGPTQQGFGEEELNALNTQADTGVARDYENAEKQARTQYASEGGGNEYIPSGQEEEVEADIGAQAAGKRSELRNQITEANYATGRQNWLTAIEGLEKAPSVMDPANAFNETAVGGGKAASDTANEIAQANEAPFSAITGMLGGLGSAVIGENPGGIFD